MRAPSRARRVAATPPTFPNPCPATVAPPPHRFARAHPGLSVATVHADRVHDPGHDPFVRPHIGGGDVLAGTDDDAYLRGVAPGEGLQLRGGESLRVNDDAALGAAVRQVHNGAL